MGGAVCVNMMDGRKEFLTLSCWSLETYTGGCIACVSVNVLKFVLCYVLLVFVTLCEFFCCLMVFKN